jgi:transposase InsO family protein
MTGHPTAQVCQVLRIGRATAYRGQVGRPGFYQKPADPAVQAQIRAIIRQRGSYGYRRVTVLVNRTFGTGYNRKRIQRVMQLAQLTVPVPRRLRHGRPHTGRIARARSNERWCSDCCEVAAYNGDVVRIGFVLDCHDREGLALEGWLQAPGSREIQHLFTTAVATRFDAGRAPVPVELLSDNGSVYTALPTILRAEQLGLVPITTPPASPESNGMAEAFVHTLRRDYFAEADLSTGPAILRQLPAMLVDYNTQAPHSALGMRAPLEYRQALAAGVV